MGGNFLGHVSILETLWLETFWAETFWLETFRPMLSFLETLWPETFWADTVLYISKCVYVCHRIMKYLYVTKQRSDHIIMVFACLSILT